MSANTDIDQAPQLRRFSWPKLTLAWFVARQNARSAILWAVIFGGFAAANIVGYEAAYPTEAAREQLAGSLGSNVGLQLLVGRPLDMTTIAGFTDWRVLGTFALVGSIWAFMTSTRVFRGDEAAGRWEPFLAGQTTARRAALNAVGGLILNLLLFFGVAALLITVFAQPDKSGITATGSLSFAFAGTVLVALFMSVGLLASQVMSSRSRAAAVSAVVFAVFFLMRGIGDSISGARWLLDITPLGWIERSHPLISNDIKWLFLTLGLSVVLTSVAVFLAGRRDMGASLVAGNDTARARLGLLDSPLGAAWRLTRAQMVSWITGVTVVALLLGSLAKSAGEALAASSAAGEIFNRLTSATEVFGAKTYLGIAFFMIITITMLYAANALSAMREEEAAGRLENILVRPVARTQWLAGRVLLSFGGICAALFFAVLAFLLMTAVQATGVATAEIIQAGVNAVAPAVFVLGFGVFCFGFLPRLASSLAYGVIAWSFLVQMIGSMLNLNQWILNLSVLHHVALAPAAEPDWTAVSILAGAGLGLAIAGMSRFRTRDLVGE